jgi:hypothetical protein
LSNGGDNKGVTFIFRVNPDLVQQPGEICTGEHPASPPEAGLEKDGERAAHHYRHYSCKQVEYDRLDGKFSW